jgi:hypothetical protein
MLRYSSLYSETQDTSRNVKKWAHLIYYATTSLGTHKGASVRLSLIIQLLSNQEGFVNIIYIILSTAVSWLLLQVLYGKEIIRTRFSVQKDTMATS